jgi:hypothetical protein
MACRQSSVNSGVGGEVEHHRRDREHDTSAGRRAMCAARPAWNCGKASQRRPAHASTSKRWWRWASVRLRRRFQFGAGRRVRDVTLMRVRDGKIVEAMAYVKGA